jgi:hypothetical protein
MTGIDVSADILLDLLRRGGECASKEFSFNKDDIASPMFVSMTFNSAEEADLARDLLRFAKSIDGDRMFHLFSAYKDQVKIVEALMMEIRDLNMKVESLRAIR